MRQKTILPGLISLMLAITSPLAAEIKADLVPKSLPVAPANSLPRLIFSNNGEEVCKLQGKVKIRDAWEKETTIPVTISIAPHEQKQVVLPVPSGRQGVWRIHWNLKNTTTKQTLQGNDRYAYMIPAGYSDSAIQGEFLIGVQIHLIDYPMEIGGDLCRIAGMAGAQVGRFSCRWSWYIQPKSAADWNLSRLERAVSNLEHCGIMPELVLGGDTPRWAIATNSKLRDSRRWTGRRPTYKVWKDFTSRLAAHFKGRIPLYEIWNEPDLVYFANFSIEEYIQLQKIGYTEIKKSDAAAKILSAGLAGMGEDNRAWSEAILADGNFDIFAWHGHGNYSHYFPQVSYCVEQLKGKNIRWYANETALSATGTTEYYQAVTLFKKLFLAWANGAVGFTWYNLRNTGNNPENSEHNYGLVTHSLQAKLNYLTFNTITTYFRNAKFLGLFSLRNTISSYRFSGEKGDSLYTFWNENSGANDCIVQFSKVKVPYAELIDLAGNVHRLQVTNNILFVPLKSEPQILRLPEGQREAIQFDGEMCRPKGLFLIGAGEKSEFKIRLSNLTGQKSDFKLTCIFPDGVTGITTQKLSLQPHEKKLLKIPVQASPDFFSFQTNPVSMKLLLERNNGGKEQLSFPILTRISIPKQNFPEKPQFELNRFEQTRNLLVNAPENAHKFWTGPKDLSAQVFIAQGHDTLKLRILVVDDIHIQKETGAAVWKGDNVQLAINLPTQDKYWEIGLTHLGPNRSEVFIWQAPRGYDAKKIMKEIQLKTSRDEQRKLTQYEVELPASAIGLFQQTGYHGFQINLLVNDNDGEDRESYMAIAPGLGENKDPLNFPMVAFSQE